jgi:hypothetical protein
LQRHSGHCSAILDVVKAHGDRTSPRLLLCLVRPPVNGTLEPARGRRPDKQPLHHHPRSCSCTGTAPRRPKRSKIRQDGRQLRGTARHASTLRRIVRHACKLLSPWPIKGGAVPQPQGGHEDGRRTLAHFPPSPRYWCLPQSVPLGPGGPASSPASLVAPLCKHYGATQYSALSHLTFRRKPSAYLYACQDQVSCI